MSNCIIPLFAYAYGNFHADYFYAMVFLHIMNYMGINRVEHSHQPDDC